MLMQAERARMPTGLPGYFRKFGLVHLLSVVVLICQGCHGTLPSDVGLTSAEETLTEVVVLERLSDHTRPVARGATTVLRPASTQKLVTTAAALDLGILETQAETSVYAHPEQPGWVVMVGGGDPFLSRDDLRNFAIALHAAFGQTPILGVVADASRYSGPLLGQGWMWDDEPSPFQARVSALTVDEGCIEVPFPGDLKEGVATQFTLPLGHEVSVVWDEAGHYPERFIERITTQDTDRFLFYARSVASLPKQTRVTVSDPARLAAASLAHELAQLRGTNESPIRVEVSRSPGLPRGRRLTQRARSWREILIRLNKESHNLAAECLLRELPLLQGAAVGSAEGGLRLVREYLRRLGVPDHMHRIVDGSGLSHYNLLTAEVLLAVLRDHSGDSPLAEAFLATLPRAGVDGTLRQRLTEAPGHERIAAKTGTLGGVANLAGYIEGFDGERWLFVMLTQNYVGSARPHRDRQDQTLLDFLERTKAPPLRNSSLR